MSIHNFRNTMKPAFGKAFVVVQFCGLKHEERLMSKFKKIDKHYQLSDSTVNVYGFRLLTEGYLIDEYKKNPIGYYMHLRDNGVVVRWEDLKIEGDKVLGKPVVNLSNPRGQQTVDEIENGFLNGASVGHIVVLEWSDAPELKLPGQTGPTITKWYNRECSLVDVPGNHSSLTSLYDLDGNPINLSDLTPKKINMKQIFFTPAMLAALNLKDDADASTVTNCFNDLVAKAAKVDQLQTQLQSLQSAKQKAEDDLTELKNKSVKETVKSLVAAALAEKKITKELGDKLEVDYATNPDGLKNLLGAMPKYQSITDQIENKNADQKAVSDLIAKSWDELFATGQTEVLKTKDLAAFKAKYKETFGKDYQG